MHCNKCIIAHPVFWIVAAHQQMNTVWRDIRVQTWGRSVSLEGRLWIITELVMCSFGLFISGPLSVMRVIILSCCSHYVTHRWRCVYLSILFPRCTSAFLLSGLAWWEGLHQDWWRTKRFFFLPREKVGTVLAIPSAQPKHNQQNKPEALQAWRVYSTNTHVCIVSTQSSILFLWHYQPAAMTAESSCCCSETSHYFQFHIRVLAGRLELLIVTQRCSSSAEEETEHLQGYQAIAILDNLYSGAASWHLDISWGIRPT